MSLLPPQPNKQVTKCNHSIAIVGNDRMMSAKDTIRQHGSAVYVGMVVVVCML